MGNLEITEVNTESSFSGMWGRQARLLIGEREKSRDGKYIQLFPEGQEKDPAIAVGKQDEGNNFRWKRQVRYGLRGRIQCRRGKGWTIEQ